MDALLAEARTTIERVATRGRADLGNFRAAAGRRIDRLDRAWGQVAHLNAVVNTPELREAYNDNLPKVTEYYTEFGQDERLFAPLPRARRLAGIRRCSSRRGASVVDNALRDFRLSGAELPAATEGALQGDRGGARQSVLALRRQRARRHQRLLAL